MRLHQVLALLSLIFIALMPGCTSTETTGPITTENTSGGYLVPKGSPWYKAQAGCLYAWDGTEWYVLRTPEVKSGYIGGADVGTPEVWIRTGGSQIQRFRRTPATFRNQALKPVFLSY